jgi:hypothetical protein
VLAQAHRWVRGYRKRDGRPFFSIPGSKPGVVYMADATACTCPDARERQRVCKHSLAVAQFQERQSRRLGIMTEAEAIAAAAGTSADAQARQQAQARPYGPCISKSGCDQPAGGRSRLCGRHLDLLVASLDA